MRRAVLLRRLRTLLSMSRPQFYDTQKGFQMAKVNGKWRRFKGGRWEELTEVTLPKIVISDRTRTKSNSRQMQHTGAEWVWKAI